MLFRQACLNHAEYTDIYYAYKIALKKSRRTFDQNQNLPKISSYSITEPNHGKSTTGGSMDPSAGRERGLPCIDVFETPDKMLRSYENLDGVAKAQKIV